MLCYEGKERITSFIVERERSLQWVMSLMGIPMYPAVVVLLCALTASDVKSVNPNLLMMVSLLRRTGWESQPWALTTDMLPRPVVEGVFPALNGRTFFSCALVSDRDLLAQRFRSGNVLRAQTASRSLAIAPSDIKTSFETKIDISKKLALEIIISYTLAEWESVKEISFGKPFTSSSSLLAEAPTTGARGDCVEELETWAAAARRGKKFVEVYQARAKARHKPERLPQVGAPLGPFREFLVRTLHLQFFSTTELLFHKVPFQETTADPKEDLMTAKALQHIVSLGFVDLVVRIKGFQICSGGDHLKISIEAWLRSILLPSFGLCLYALGEGDDVDLSVRGLLRDAEGVFQQVCDLTKKVDDDFRELTLDFKHYATLLRGVVDASQLPRSTRRIRMPPSRPWSWRGCLPSSTNSTSR